MKQNPLILYLCNGKNPKCKGINGCYKDCYHTSDVRYAINDPKIDPVLDSKNFRKYVTKDGDVQFWERRYADSCDVQNVGDVHA